MSVQVLVATMNQSDFSKFKTMNLTTDALFANQSDSYWEKCESIDSHTARLITTNTRGVGINRNIACLHAEGDVIVLADDDMRYVDGYEQIIEKAFSEIPEADAIVFNIDTKGGIIQRRQNQKIKRVHFYNALNYGAARIAVKRNSIKREGILFNTNFGGGTLYSAGEDTLFICDMLKHGLKLYTYPVTIATVDQTTSTWFNGYTEKYFYDKGALFSAVSKKWSVLLCLQDAVRHWKTYRKSELSFHHVLSLMKKGRCGYKTLTAYGENS